jgi:predicted DCC family thiol-disulfide oxidoreductase YuxK
MLIGHHSDTRSIGNVRDPILSPDPSRAVLVYDGRCRFCRTVVARLGASLDRMPRTVPHQDLDLAAWGLTREEAGSGMWLLTPARHYGGVAAWSALLRAQPGARERFAGHLLRTPPFSWAADAGYAVLARVARRLPGDGS